MLRYLLLLFSGMLFHQGLIEFQEKDSMLTPLILILCSLALAIYVILHWYTLLKDFRSNLKLLRKVEAKFDEVSYESLQTGKVFTYEITAASYKRVPVNQALLDNGLQIIMGSFDSELFNFPEPTIKVQSKDGKVFFLEIPLSMVSFKKSDLKNGKYQDQLKFTMYTSNFSEDDEVLNLSVSFKRKYKLGKLYFQCTAKEITNNIQSDHNNIVFTASGFLMDVNFYEE